MDDTGEEKRPPATVARISRSMLLLLLLTLSATTLLTLFARDLWFADLLANLRIQQLIALLLLLVMCGMHRHRLGLAVVALLIAIHLPSFSSALAVSNMGVRNQSAKNVNNEASPALSVTLANVLTWNRRHDDIVADVTSRNPDLIVILELSTELAASLKAKISSTYPHAIVRPQDSGNFGIGLYSKHPLRDSQVFTLNVAVESLAATITIADQEYRIYATHTLPPMGPSRFVDRNEHLQQLATRIQRFQSHSPGTPVVLVGDLNLTPWSPHFAKLEQSSRLLRARDGFDVTPTWYRFPAFPFGLVLDHALISEHLHCVSHEVGPFIGSDHRSVTIVFEVR